MYPKMGCEEPGRWNTNSQNCFQEKIRTTSQDGWTKGGLPEAALLGVRGLQEDLLLYNKEFDWSLSLVPGKENLNLWNFPSKISVLIM